jgi:hypothetical protein
MQGQMEKSAEQVVFENSYWNTLAEKSAALEANATEELFNAAYVDHISKIASLDPQYGQQLQDAQVKMAFDQSFYATCQQHGVVFS